MDTLIVIEGPTAVGKTSLAVELARLLGTDVINADSRQMFKGMRVGTAAPSVEEMKGVKHHFVEWLEIDDYYSAAMFEEDVLKLLDKMFAEGTNGKALMSGGSMMYIDAVCKGIDYIPTITAHTRQWMRERLETEGLETLCEELRVLDPEYYNIVDRRNVRRVVHALEICHQTGSKYSSFRTKTVKERKFRIKKVGLTRPREELYDRINRRVDQMIASGLEEEARRLLPYSHLNALNTVGYKEMFAYIKGEKPLDETVQTIKGNTRNYARKQLTWMRKDPDVRWFNPNETEAITDYITADD